MEAIALFGLSTECDGGQYSAKDSRIDSSQKESEVSIRFLDWIPDHRKFPQLAIDKRLSWIVAFLRG